MAQDDPQVPPLDVIGVDGEDNSTRRPPNRLLIIGGVILVGIMVFWLLGRDSPPTGAAAPSVDTSRTGEKEDVAPKRARGFGQDQRAAFDVYQNELTRMREDQDKLMKDLAAQQASFEQRVNTAVAERLRETRNTLTEQLNRLTEAVSNQNRSRVEDHFRGAPRPTGDSGVPTPSEYPDAGDTIPIDDIGGSADMAPAPPPAPRSYRHLPPVSRAIAPVEVDPEAPTATPSATTDSAVADTDAYRPYPIAAASLVEVTLLHGVDCPVSGGLGSALTGSDGAGLLDNRPLILPITGRFKGPNGQTYDIGHAHLSGVCVGVDMGDDSRAAVRVERLSYATPDGQEQTVPALGYLVDTRDNRQDIAGRLIEVRGDTLWQSMLASGLAGMASVAQAGQYTVTASSLAGAGTQQSLTGSATKAALGAGVSQGLQDLATYLNEHRDQRFDVVRIDGGVTATFLLTEAITELRVPVAKQAVSHDLPLI